MIVMLGGWLPTRNATGEISKECSPWFSVELTAVNAPWAFYRGLLFRTIAAWEAMATLVVVVAFSVLMPRQSDAQIVMRSITDNKGNEGALTRLSSTKFPLSLISMELAAQLDRRGLRLEMQWAPREHNREADALSNGDSIGFVPGNRTVTNFDHIDWIVLDDMMHFGLEFFCG